MIHSDRAGVAVIGAGAGGLTAAHVLQRERAVTLFEAQARLGGHARTHLAATPSGGAVALDSGFIVYNPSNYPLLSRLFAELGVATQGSEMSFSVSCDGCGLRYLSGSSLRTLPSRPSSIDRATWEHLLAETDRFNAAAAAVLAHPPGDLTLGEMLDRGAYTEFFVTHMVLPLVCAVWSCGPQSARQYPAAYLLRFLANHGLLRGIPASRWRTVAGGCAIYVAALGARLSAVRTATRVTAVTRVPGGVEVVDDSGRAQRFAGAVIATHPGDALLLRADATPQEKSVLSAIGYVASSVVLHTDARLLPERPGDRGAWNYRQRHCGAADDQASVSYHLNALQRIPGDIDYVVTLNADEQVAKDLVIAVMRDEHPLYSPESLAAQRQLAALNSAAIAYAGAYHGWGFHEDACRSGVLAAQALGVTW